MPPALKPRRSTASAEAAKRARQARRPPPGTRQTAAGGGTPARCATSSTPSRRRRPAAGQRKREGLAAGTSRSAGRNWRPAPTRWRPGSRCWPRPNRSLSSRVTELQTLQKQLEDLNAAQKQKEEAGWQGLVKVYETMKPKDAATIFNELSMPVLLQVLDRMKDAKAACGHGGNESRQGPRCDCGTGADANRPRCTRRADRCVKTEPKLAADTIS